MRLWWILLLGLEEDHAPEIQILGLVASWDLSMSSKGEKFVQEENGNV